MIVPGTSDVIKAARLARRGCWPIQGGWLDQAQILMEAVEYTWMCESPYRENNQD